MVAWSLDAVIMLLVLMVVYLLSSIQGYVINAIVQETDPITCWTCPNKTDNDECNNWAPDKHCPTNHTICQTVHRVDVNTGKSVRVNKMCSLPSECTDETIGCHDTGIPGVKDCVSCCNYAYCNEPVPFNHSAAIAYSSLPTSGALQVAPYGLHYLVLQTVLVLLAACIGVSHTWLDLHS